MKGCKTGMLQNYLKMYSHSENAIKTAAVISEPSLRSLRFWGSNFLWSCV